MPELKKNIILSEIYIIRNNPTMNIQFAKHFRGAIRHFAILLLAVLSLPSFWSCKEDINAEDYAIANKKQLMELLQADTAQYSGIISLFNEVKLGLSDNASPISRVLTTRGNYTVFAPTNEALATFLREEMHVGSISELSAEQKKMIATNCIIDNGSQPAYETADFPTNGSAFSLSTLDDRTLNCMQKESGEFYINADSKVIKSNVEASNGMLHTVDHVIYPSAQSVAQVVAQTPNLRIMGELLKVTGWADSINTQNPEEEAYVQKYADRIGTKQYFVGEGGNYPFMSKRHIRYTAFVEPDAVLNRDWGVPMPIYNETTQKIENWNEIMAVISDKCEHILGTNADHDDYTSQENAVNQFVAYHLVRGGMPLNGMVAHYNEYGYDKGSDPVNPQTKVYTVNVWDYYTTMGKYRSLVKVTQLAKGNHEYYLNRISKYNNSFKGNYEELGFTPYTAENGLNVRIMEQNTATNENGEEVSYTNDAMNGYYHTIDGILINADVTRQSLGKERIRMDLTTMLPEFLSNNLRITGERTYFPIGYFDNITHESESTQFYYLHSKVFGGAPGWKDGQGDEILVSGRYNFTMKMPPVPKSGTYEVRMGVCNNQNRSMVQIYFDDKPFPTTPTSLPVDQREFPGDWGSGLWVQDRVYNNDETLCREADRNLHNQGYLKGPKYYNVNGNLKETIREYYAGGGYYPNLRYVVARQYLDQNKTYYIRFKCAVDNSNTQFFLDYFEYCPSEIYNSNEGEDVW